MKHFNKFKSPPVILHIQLGTAGKSIRTETSWMSPVEFVKAASCQTDGSWKKDIKYDGKPLGDLTEVTTVTVVSQLYALSSQTSDWSQFELLTVLLIFMLLRVKSWCSRLMLLLPVLF